jgi:hypothetical protein
MKQVDDVYIIPTIVFMEEVSLVWIISADLNSYEKDLTLMKAITSSNISKEKSKIPTAVMDVISIDFKEVIYEASRVDGGIPCLMCFNEDATLRKATIVEQGEQ